jgi:hypothetical protein
LEDLGLGNSNLNVTEFLRPWHFAGWTYFFKDTDIKTALPFDVNPVHWPYPWNEFSKKVSPTAHLFISYHDLGKDLSTQPSQERRAFWQKFIALCKLPKGSIAFWPFVVFQNDFYNYQINEFLFTLSSFTPHAIVFFVNDNEKNILQTKFDNFFKNSNTCPRCIYFSSVDNYLNAPVDEIIEVISQIQSVL